MINIPYMKFAFENWVKSKFAAKHCFTERPTTLVTELVLFDGDNVSRRAFLDLHNQDALHTQYTWIQNSKWFPKYITKSKVHAMHPSAVGKEAVDTYLSMIVVDHCHKNPALERVYLVSNDADFVDTIVNACQLFSHIKFTLMINTSGPSYRMPSQLRECANKHKKLNMAITFYKPK